MSPKRFTIATIALFSASEQVHCALVQLYFNSMLTQAKALPPGDVSLMALQPQLFHWDVIQVKLVIVAHVGHVSHVSSMQ